MRILIGSPTAAMKDYCFLDYTIAARSLQWQYGEVGYMMADNTDDQGQYARRMSRLGWDVAKIDPKGKPLGRILAESHQALAEACILGKWDFLLHLESDMIPTSQMLHRLYDAYIEASDYEGKAVPVSALYFHGLGADSHLLTQVMDDRGMDYRSWAKLPIGQHQGQLIKAWQTGIGAILIPRSVLEAAPFRDSTEYDTFPDSVWMYDLARKQIPLYLDSSVLVEHRNSAWTAHAGYDLSWGVDDHDKVWNG